MLLPRRDTIASATTSGGKAKAASVSRMITVSVRPPR